MPGPPARDRLSEPRVSSRSREVPCVIFSFNGRPVYKTLQGAITETPFKQTKFFIQCVTHSPIILVKKKQAN